VPDDVLLFRYSALTFNGHRIHYDRRYVTEVEGYPGLVVHGPLIATLLLDLLRRQCPRPTWRLSLQGRAAHLRRPPMRVNGAREGTACGCGRRTTRAG
jgi:3-methylfumaryl-CoA hydratase